MVETGGTGTYLDDGGRSKGQQTVSSTTCRVTIGDSRAVLRVFTFSEWLRWLLIDIGNAFQLT